MITEVCETIRNWFTDDEDIHIGSYTVSGGTIAPLDFLKNGQYFRIVGSTLNDGVYKYPTTELTDENFDGAVWAMKVPPSFISLCSDIKAYNESDEAKPSAFSSESFGGYSYSKATDANGAPIGWQKVFASRLKKWRKI